MMSDKLKDKYIKIDSMDFGDINIKVELEDFDSKNVDHYDMSVEKKVHKYKDFKIKNAFEIKETDHDFKDIDMKEDFDPNVINIKGGDNRHYIFIKEVNINEQMNILEHEDEQTKFEPLVESFESIVDSHPSTSQLESCHINRIEDSNMCLENLSTFKPLVEDHMDSVGRECRYDLILKKNSNTSGNIVDLHPSTSEDKRCYKNRIDGSNKYSDDFVSRSQNSLQSSTAPTRLSSFSLEQSLDPKKMFECSECKFRTSRKDHIARHNRTHTGEKPFKCTFCNYRASDNSSIIKHTRIHTGEKPFKCTYCDYRTSNNSNLRDHIKTHTGEKPYKCNDCDYSASTKTLLLDHIIIHTGEKPFECNQCDFSTSHRSGLKRHFRVHTGEKPFNCNLCDYSASSGSNLQRHIRIHTGEKPFKCIYCDHCAAQKSDLQKHIRVHTEEKPFKCELCEYTASRKSHLNLHVKRHR